jgi:peptide/nickel transport system ATP-binding protein
MLEIRMRPDLLEATNLTKSFQVKAGAFSHRLSLKAVNGVSFRLAEGETLGIAGESGSGKTTLGKLLMGLAEPDTGEILFRGNQLKGLSAKEMFRFRREVQMIFQDPYASLNPRMRVGEIVGEPLKIHGLAASRERTSMVIALMKKVGLSEEQMYRYPHEFSGGQRQRIGIARALAVSPRLIIADEPVSALDLSIQAQIINLLQSLKKELNLAFILIAHDLSILSHMSDRIAVMYLGSVVETGATEDVFKNRLHPYTEALISAAPRLDVVTAAKKPLLQGDIPSPISPPSGCPFHTRCPHARPDVCPVIVPALEEKEPGHMAACHFSLEIFR